MTHRVGILLPVVQSAFADKILQQMNSNTVLPDKVVIADDTNSGYLIPPGLNFPVALFRTKERAKVNLTFNIGLSMIKDTEFVSVGNDDVIIHDHFFEKILLAFKNNKNFGVVSQKQVNSVTEVGYDPVDRYTVLHMREGAIVTFRRKVFDKIPPIPKELEVFCADDWWWNHIIKLGYLWGRIESSRIYHYVSYTMNQRNLNKFMERDVKIFNELTGGRVKLPKEFR